MRSLKNNLALLGGVVLVLAVSAFLRSSQRSLLLTAQEDIRILESANSRRLVGTLKNGETVRVVRCEDTKSFIVPLIDNEDGTVRALGAGKYSLKVSQTGFLSWPQFLSCGDY